MNLKRQKKLVVNMKRVNLLEADSLHISSAIGSCFAIENLTTAIPFPNLSPMSTNPKLWYKQGACINHLSLRP